MKQLVSLFVLAVLLMAATSALRWPSVPREQQNRNRLQWMALPEYERERLRKEWTDLNAEPRAVQLELMRRLATLDRLRTRRNLNGQGMPATEEIKGILEGVTSRLRLEFGEGLARSEGEMLQQLRISTQRRIDGFLDNLVEAGRLSLEQREAAQESSWDDYVRNALEIQKAEEIFLYSEFADGDDSVELEELAPLDVLDEMLEIRRLRGFLGRAGAVLGLSAEEQRLLSEASNEEFYGVAKRLMEPKAREYMVAQLGMSKQQVDRVLSQPYRDLERSLHRLLMRQP
jgi:hypothetical protein